MKVWRTNHSATLAVLLEVLYFSGFQYHKTIFPLQNMEQEMEAQQATFGTFNLAAEKVAENLEENSPGVTDIQEKMEEFNDRWNKITTEVSSRIALVRIDSGTYLVVFSTKVFCFDSSDFVCFPVFFLILYRPIYTKLVSDNLVSRVSHLLIRSPGTRLGF